MKKILLIVVAVLCIGYVIAPDPFPIVVDDVGALAAAVLSIVKVFQSLPDKK